MDLDDVTLSQFEVADSISTAIPVKDNFNFLKIIKREKSLKNESIGNLCNSWDRTYTLFVFKVSILLYYLFIIL